MNPLRSIFVAASLCLVALAPVPVANAAQADVALLHEYAGNWRGEGALTGAEEGRVTCRLTMQPNGEKMSFSGRCTLAGSGTQSFQGAIVYNDAARRYEAVARGTDGGAVGRRSGGGIVFNLDGANERGTVRTTLSLTSGRIVVDVSMVEAKSSAKTQARIPFTRS